LDGAAAGDRRRRGTAEAKSFTFDGEAVVVGPNGLTDFEALRRRGSGDVASGWTIQPILTTARVKGRAV
jgi:hypothetical protein